MEDIFSSSFDSDYHFLGFSKLELDMDTAGSGKVNEDIRTDRKSRSRARSRSRSRDPHSKHGRDDEYKERRHKRDKPTQERIPPSRRSSSTSSSFSSDSRQAAGGRLRPTTSSVLYHIKSRKRSRSRSRSPHDKSRSYKRGCCDNQKQDDKASERYASGQVSNLAFRVQRIEGFLEQIATHMGLSSQDAEPGPGAEPQSLGLHQAHIIMVHYRIEAWSLEVGETTMRFRYWPAMEVFLICNNRGRTCHKYASILSQM